MSKPLVPHKEQSDGFDPCEVIGTVDELLINKTIVVGFRR